MKRKFVCTKEMPFNDQVDVNEWPEISEIVVSGYLGGQDLMALSCMSLCGSLLRLDMSGVTELNTDGMDGTIESTPFYNDEKGVEEVYLPNIEKLTYPMFYNCPNLKRVDFPSSIKHLDTFLAKCPNVEEIYVPEDLNIDCDRRFDSDICFMGSGKRFRACRRLCGRGTCCILLRGTSGKQTDKYQQTEYFSDALQFIPSHSFKAQASAALSST